MQVFHWSRPCNRAYDSRVGCKVVELREKARENAESVMKSPTGRYSYRQAVMTFPTRCRVGDVFCSASRRSTTTSPKPLTDKPDNKQTSRKDKQTSREHVPDPSRQDWLFLWVGIYSRDPESGFISHYINPPPLWCTIHFTLQRWQEHIKSNW